MSDQAPARRQFLTILPGLVVAIAASTPPGWATVLSRVGRNNHPDPRPGVDASRVTPRERLRDHPDAIAVFDLVRQIPQVMDGIFCYCGCAESPGWYSLLSCYEEDGMARMCQICQGQAKLVHRLHRQGKTLTQIRAAVDAEFG
jgi:hypothetical protein